MRISLSRPGRAAALLAAALVALVSLSVATPVYSARAASIPTAVPVTDANIFWSPYNWKSIGTTAKQTTPAGGYLKVAFTGTALGLGVDTSFMTGVNLSAVILHAYVDGSTTPLTKTLADVSSGTVIFSNLLAAGSHYATIYLAQSTGADRWTVPTNALRVTSVQLDGSGTASTLPIIGTPITPASKKILVYGDSITEGAGTTGAESAYSAVVGHRLGVEYGQVGYGSVGWLAIAQGTNKSFYDANNPATSIWRNYDSTTSRLAGPSLTDGFVGGSPDMIVITMGINDANGNKGASNVQSRLSAWLTDARQAAGPDTWICVVQPFNFGNAANTSYPAYKQAIITAVSEYSTANPSDSRVCPIIDLGSEGYDIVVANSSDKLHPNNAGAALLGTKIAEAVAPRLGILLPVTTPPTQTASNGQTYGLQSAASGKFADVTSPPSAAQYPPVVQNASTSAATQRWTLTSSTSGTFTATNRGNNKCLDVKGASNTVGAPVIFWTCNGVANQRWQLAVTSDGLGYTFVSATSGQCLEVKNASMAEGAALVQNVCNGSAEQTWKFVDAQPTTGAAYAVQAVHSSKNLDATTTQSGSPVPVLQNAPAAVASQRWTPTAVSDHVLTLTTGSTGYCLDVAGASVASAALIVSAPCTSSTSQQWRLLPNSAGTSYQIRSVFSGLCVDVNAASTVDSAKVIQYACGSAQNQQWRFLP